ncbi:transposase [Streptomyces sp. NPDC040750]|uniref:transposase n=1 Tax=Streptomyces sp. NPDC040750 TaxID=3154491 RepID=UPI0034111B41
MLSVENADNPAETGELLRQRRRHGMRHPELAVDGAMSLWKALAAVFPTGREQRYGVHRATNITNALPKSAQPGATKVMRELHNAESRAPAENATEAFATTCGTKQPMAVAKIADDLEGLLALYDFPAEHWVHLRTTNPVESTFSTMRLRTQATRGAGSPAAALAMVVKLVESAQARRRAITGAHLVPLVRAGACFENGILVERPEAVAA